MEHWVILGSAGCTLLSDKWITWQQHLSTVPTRPRHASRITHARHAIFLSLLLSVLFTWLTPVTSPLGVHATLLPRLCQIIGFLGFPQGFQTSTDGLLHVTSRGFKLRTCMLPFGYNFIFTKRYVKEGSICRSYAGGTGLALHPKPRLYSLFSPLSQKFRDTALYTECPPHLPSSSMPIHHPYSYHHSTHRNGGYSHTNKFFHYFIHNMFRPKQFIVRLIMRNVKMMTDFI